MSARDKYQRPAKEQRAAQVHAARTCWDTQKETAQRTIVLCTKSKDAKIPGTFAHAVLELLAAGGATIATERHDLLCRTSEPSTATA